MTNTKQKSDDRPWKDGEDESNDVEGKLNIASSNHFNYVVNSTVIENKGCTLLRLDLMSISGDDGRYYSSTYDLTTSNGTNGLFDFLDDYYSKKFGFFTSSKTNQALLTALNRIETDFHKKHCFNFKEYCETVTEESLNKVLKNPLFNNVLNGKIANGYTISGEANELYMQKHDAISVGNYMETYGKMLVTEFKKVLKSIDDKKFCCACINNTEKIPQSFLIDPVIGLPMIVYNMEFAEIFVKKICRQYVESDLFKNADIDSISIDLWAVPNGMTTKNITDMMGSDGEIKGDYEELTESNFNDKFLGKYETLSFTRKSYGKDDDNSTIIGYN